MKPQENYCWSCANKPKSRKTCYSHIRDLCPYGDGPPTLPSMWVERVEVVEPPCAVTVTETCTGHETIPGAPYITLTITYDDVKSFTAPLDAERVEAVEAPNPITHCEPLDDDTELQAYDVAPHGYYNGHPIVYDAETDLYVADGVRCVDVMAYDELQTNGYVNCHTCARLGDRLYHGGRCDGDCNHWPLMHGKADICRWTPKD